MLNIFYKYTINKSWKFATLKGSFKKDGVVIIEWADMIEDYLPEERLEIKFKLADDEDTRIITITPYGKEYEDLCEAVLWESFI